MRHHRIIDSAIDIALVALTLPGAAVLAEDAAGRHADNRWMTVVDTPVSTRATVRIAVFGLFRPRELVVRPAGSGVLVIRAGSDTLTFEDSESARLRAVGGSVECETQRRVVSAQVVRASGRSANPAESEFMLSVPGKLDRRYHGTLEVNVADSRLEDRDSGPAVLVGVVTMDLETAVASAVSAESPPGAPLAALEAQAVASRSYYVASHPRHSGFDFCDTTHCQFLRSPPAKSDPAWVATAATRGLIVTHRGKPVAALYSASCGGRTHSLADVGLRANPDDGGYPYYSVECPYCRLHAAAWACRLDLRGLPASGDGTRLRPGVNSEVARLRTARKVGWSALPGGDYQVRLMDASLVVEGRGAGHGVGLCQEGARGMALTGSDFREILMHYYPNTSLTVAR